MLLKFSEWVNVLNESHDQLNEASVEEARRFQPKGGAGGAFGKTGRGGGGRNQGTGTYTHGRDQQRSLQGPGAYQAQIAFGKEQEKKIFAAAAEKCGLKVTPASAYEDMHLKIDGYWWPEGGGAKVPFSMKYRDTGPDILFEVIKPYVTEPILDPRNMLGRDVKPPGKPANTLDPHSAMGPKYIMFLSREGNKLSIIPAEPCYQVIKQMLQDINDNGWNQEKRGGRKVHITGQGVMRFQTDESNGRQKVMAYLPMRTVTPVFQCDVNIAIG